jgi:signal transduction histidine kinase
LLEALSHDLRAPLRAANGFSRALLRQATGLDPQGQDYLRRISQATLVMGDQIEGICRLARVAVARVRAERIDLGAMARGVLDQLQAGEPERRVAVQIAGELEVMGDPHLLRSLVDSLLGNAWRFTRPAPEAAIELGRRQEAAETVYFVRDNGVGFDMAQARHLFEPFGRVHGEDTGTGLGLATARRIVHRHGGRIWADAAPGRGATFSFTLGELDVG